MSFFLPSPLAFAAVTRAAAILAADIEHYGTPVAPARAYVAHGARQVDTSGVDYEHAQDVFALQNRSLSFPVHTL